MIDVADRPDVYVGLVSAVCLLRLRSEGSPAQRHSTLRDKEEPNNLTTAKKISASQRAACRFVQLLTNLKELCRRLGEES